MNTGRTTGKAFAAMTAMCALAFVLACMLFAPQALAKKHLEAPTTVSDDITRIHVNKLDADTHEFVQGATMVIIEKDTGLVVDEWVTGSSTHQNEKGLDVDKVYVLRELAAPEGFGKVEDVEFVVNATEGTGITILSQGDDSELVESYKVNLYDKATTVEDEIVVTKVRGTSPNATATKPAPKTGDETPILPIACLVIVGALIVALLQVSKRGLKD